jgi:SPP1 gp7 family putative phage head morphogenesis protein
VFKIRKPRGKNISLGKSSNANHEALRRLRSFLDTEEPVTVDVLTRFWNEQRAAVGYGEISQMLVTHHPSSVLLTQWRQEYAMLINNRLAPQWANAMSQAAAAYSLRFPQLLYDSLIDSAQAYIRERGAALMTMLTNEQANAMRALLSQAVSFEGMTADMLSRLVRPLVGLTVPQAKANYRYWNAVWSNGVENGLSNRAALERADRMAADYAGRQHRYRAMSIARTELAMAYNEGAYGAVEAAREQGYIGDVRKVWLTAADERVCPICVPLDGVVVNMNDLFNTGSGRLPVKIPPAHPQCRCAVDYEEVVPSLQSQHPNGILNAGGVGDTDGNTIITAKRRIDFADEAVVNAEIDDFINTHANDNVENALVIASSGNVYHLRGNEVTVNPGILSRSELAGSIVIHNHPGLNADSFSRKDFISFFDMSFSREDVVFGNSHHILRYNGLPVSASKAAELYRNAFAQVRWNALATNVPIGLEQFEIMQQLSRTMEGLIFIENTR